MDSAVAFRWGCENALRTLNSDPRLIEGLLGYIRRPPKSFHFCELGRLSKSLLPWSIPWTTLPLRLDIFLKYHLIWCRPHITRKFLYFFTKFGCLICIVCCNLVLIISSFAKAESSFQFTRHFEVPFKGPLSCISSWWICWYRLCISGLWGLMQWEATPSSALRQSTDVSWYFAKLLTIFDLYGSPII